MMWNRWLKYAGSLALMLSSISACSSIPRDIANGPESSITLSAVQQDFESAQGTEVRWGGSIVETTNASGNTRIEIVARSLLSNARPSSGDRTEGRFVARISGFLDPLIYAPGRMLTVVGVLQKPEPGKIGEQEYMFPVVEAQSHYLWEQYSETDELYPYRYYDPWDPWFGYYHPGFYSRYHFHYWPHYKYPPYRHRLR